MVLDNFATGKRENLFALADYVELIEGDVQSYERVHNAVVGAEVVFHQAALPSVPRSVQDPSTSNATNVTGTLNVLLAARDSQVRRFVFASSSSVYGANPGLPKREDMATLPIALYAVAKQPRRATAAASPHVFGLETVAATASSRATSPTSTTSSTPTSARWTPTAWRAPSSTWRPASAPR